MLWPKGQCVGGGGGWASKGQPKTKVIIKVSHSVVAEGTVCVCGGRGGGCKGRQA